MTKRRTRDVDVDMPKSSARFPRVWLMEAQTTWEDDYIVKGILQRGSVAVMFGPWGCGKSFCAIDLAAHIACGLPWREHRVRQGLVVYVAAEAGVSIQRRFAAWRDHHLGEAHEEAVPLVILTRGANLLLAEDVEALIVELHDIATEAKVPLALVVIDTLSRSIPGGEENSPQDMTRVVAVADRIRDEFGATTLLVHHTGKDTAKGARGHSSVEGAADTLIAVESETLTVIKLRDGVNGRAYGFSLDVVDLGEDSDGDALSTCVVAATETAGTAKPVSLSAGARIALKALTEVLGEVGELMAGSSTIPRGVRAVDLKTWRTRFRIRYGSDDATGEAVRKAFQRARQGLLGAEVIVVSDPYVWLTQRTP